MVNINSSIEEELQKFKEISFKLGSNKNLVQAAGGNTSIKINDSMYIKASGTWLQDSLNKDIFVEVNLKSIQKKLMMRLMIILLKTLYPQMISDLLQKLLSTH